MLWFWWILIPLLLKARLLAVLRFVPIFQKNNLIGRFGSIALNVDFSLNREVTWCHNEPIRTAETRSQPRWFYESSSCLIEILWHKLPSDITVVLYIKKIENSLKEKAQCYSVISKNSYPFLSLSCLWRAFEINS